MITPSQTYWLLPAFVVFTVAFGGTLVPKINLILAIICRNYCAERSTMYPNEHTVPITLGGDDPACRVPEVQALVSKFTLYDSLIAGILSAIVAPKFGSLSDRYGRTLVLCAGSLGLLGSELITILLAKFPDTISINWILFGSVLDGLGGSFTAAMALAYAYISDCTAPERRNVAFGYIHGCLFLGIALGPLLAAYVVKATGQIVSIFYIAIGAHAFYLLWIAVIVPESLSKERQKLARHSAMKKDKDVPIIVDTDDVGLTSHKLISSFTTSLGKVNFLAPLTILYPSGPGVNPAVRRNLIALAAVDTTLFGVAMGAITITLIYSKYAFGWGNFEQSIYTSIVNTSRVTVLVVILPLVTRIIRGPVSRNMQRGSGADRIDLGIIRLAIVFDLLGYVGFATVQAGSLFILSGVLAAIGGMGSPTLGAAITKHVPPDQTGSVLGAIGELHALARVVAPIIFNTIYAKTVGKYTPAVFVCLAVAFGLALIFSLFVRPNGELICHATV